MKCTEDEIIFHTNFLKEIFRRNSEVWTLRTETDSFDFWLNFPKNPFTCDWNSQERHSSSYQILQLHNRLRSGSLYKVLFQRMFERQN